MELEILSVIYNQSFHKALNKIEQTIPPIWLMRQAGRYHSHYKKLKEKYSFEQLCRQPELSCEVTLGPIKDFDFDAAILFSDILFPLDFLGMGLTFNPGPQFKNHLEITHLQNIEEGSFDNYIKFQSDSLNLIRSNLPKNKSLIGFVGGPITLYHFATRHNGNDPSLINPFLETMDNILTSNINIQLQTDLDLVMIFDTEANKLSDEDFKSKVIPFVKKQSERHPHKIGYFTKNITSSKYEMLKEIIHLKLTVLGSNMDILNELNKTHLSLQGNFSNELLTLEDKNKFKSFLGEYINYINNSDSSNRIGWISSLDHGVQKTTPEGNVHMFIEQIRTKLV
ncbi:MAG: uroporphyrinogen decarboxylase [Pelagibacteraceae bacterium]|nr:uroporphyrinogen decarboxylase [Pelagibacteraceae bacterium]